MICKAKLTKGWKISIPSACRKRLNLLEGEEIIFDLKENSALLYPFRLHLLKIREKVARYVPKETSLVEKLISERRAEAENE